MNTKLEKLKAMLRDSIALAEDPNLSPAPWVADLTLVCLSENPPEDFTDDDIIAECLGSINRGKNNAVFIAHARTFHPMFSRMLLAAIDGLEAAHVSLPEGDDTAWDALDTICCNLPEDGEKLEVSDTPRTDAHQCTLNKNGPGFSIYDIIKAYEHARTLEIELRAANLKNAQEVLK